MNNGSSDVLVIGSGARESAIVWKLRQSPHVRNIYAAPGNGGTRKLGAKNVEVNPMEFGKLMAFIWAKKIDLVIVGPENPLAEGIVDVFNKEKTGARIFGPTKAAAKIEASKVFAKKFMAKYDIPTAAFQIFDAYDEAMRYIMGNGLPVVIKASGLAGGKGVRICENSESAQKILTDIMINRVHGKAGNEVVIEDKLKGLEVSVHIFCDGKTAGVVMPFTQDYKRVDNNNQGLNTGGMGAYGPLPWLDDNIANQIRKSIINPTLTGLEKEGMPFMGCLYPGLIITEKGPQALEYNARFGDPETQVLMRLLKSDLFEIINACIEGNLHKMEIEWHPGYAVCVVAASGGYPEQYQTGFLIEGLSEAEKMSDIQIFYGGVADHDNGQLYTSGGRVLSVTATGETLDQARQKAYEAMGKIIFKNMHYRNDIALLDYI